MAEVTILSMTKEIRISPSSGLAEEIIRINYKIGGWGPFDAIIPGREFSQLRLAQEISKWKKVLEDVLTKRGSFQRPA